jgi:hypothetical protein
MCPSAAEIKKAFHKLQQRLCFVKCFKCNLGDVALLRQPSQRSFSLDREGHGIDSGLRFSSNNTERAVSKKEGAWQGASCRL